MQGRTAAHLPLATSGTPSACFTSASESQRRLDGTGAIYSTPETRPHFLSREIAYEGHTRSARSGSTVGDRMLKIVVTIKRKPGLTREEFSTYYFDKHAPLA